MVVHKPKETIEPEESDGDMNRKTHMQTDKSIQNDRKEKEEKRHHKLSIDQSIKKSTAAVWCGVVLFCCWCWCLWTWLLNKVLGLVWWSEVGWFFFCSSVCFVCSCFFPFARFSHHKTKQTKPNHTTQTAKTEANNGKCWFVLLALISCSAFPLSSLLSFLFRGFHLQQMAFWQLPKLVNNNASHHNQQPKPKSLCTSHTQQPQQPQQHSGTPCRGVEWNFWRKCRFGASRTQVGGSMNKVAVDNQSASLTNVLLRAISYRLLRCFVQARYSLQLFRNQLLL